MTRLQAHDLTEQLFSTWGRALVRYAYRLTGNCESAEDLTQEAFMALYSTLCEGVEIDVPRAWAMAVVCNQASKLRRQWVRHGEVLQPIEDLDQFPQPLHNDGFRLQSGDLPKFLAQLTRREKEAVQLRLCSLSYRDIAGRLGISAKTVSTLLGRARKRFERARAEI